MEMEGHSLRKIMGHTALCECGYRAEVPVKEALSVSPRRLLDLVMDEHREHLRKLQRRKNV